MGVKLTIKDKEDPAIIWECGRVGYATSAKQLLSLLQGVIPSSLTWPAAWGCYSEKPPTAQPEKRLEVPKGRRRKEARQKAARRTGVVGGRTAPSIGMLHCANPVDQFLTRVCVAGLKIERARQWVLVSDPKRNGDPHLYHGCQFANAKENPTTVVVARRVTAPQAGEHPTPVVVQARRSKKRPGKSARPPHSAKHQKGAKKQCQKKFCSSKKRR